MVKWKDINAVTFLQVSPRSTSPWPASCPGLLPPQQACRAVHTCEVSNIRTIGTKWCWSTFQWILWLRHHGRWFVPIHPWPRRTNVQHLKQARTRLPSPRRDQRCWHSRSAPTSRESPAPASLSSLPHGSSYEHGGWKPSCPDGCCSAKMKKVINSGKIICLHNDAIVIFRGRVSYEVPWIHYDMGILQDYHIQCKSVSHTLFHTQTCLKCDSGCAVFLSIVAIYWNLRLRFHLSCFLLDWLQI